MESPGGYSWPRITIVTPSLNQGRYLESCIQSVLKQNYPNLEYIVIDGGSTDGSVDIIRKYSSKITHWCSERDRGQVDAIQKGLAVATGEFFNWINSDDLLAPGALFHVANGVRNKFDLLAGGCVNFDEEGCRATIYNVGLSPANLILGKPGASFHQPGLWWRREWIPRSGGLDLRFELAFDYDLLLRYLHLGPTIRYTSDVLAAFRLHPTSKTCSRTEAYDPERERILMALLERDELAELHPHCRQRLRQLSWWRDVARTVQTKAGSRVSRAAWLSSNVIADPALRLNRLTLGALRRILFS